MPRLAAHSATFLAGVALGVMAGYLVGLDAYWTDEEHRAAP
jgi:hypothetical protein